MSHSALGLKRRRHVPGGLDVDHSLTLRRAAVSLGWLGFRRRKV